MKLLGGLGWAENRDPDTFMSWFHFVCSRGSAMELKAYLVENNGIVVFSLLDTKTNKDALDKK